MTTPCAHDWQYFGEGGKPPVCRLCDLSHADTPESDDERRKVAETMARPRPRTMEDFLARHAARLPVSDAEFWEAMRTAPRMKGQPDAAMLEAIERIRTRRRSEGR